METSGSQTRPMPRQVPLTGRQPSAGSRRPGRSRSTRFPRRVRTASTIDGWPRRQPLVQRRTGAFDFGSSAQIGQITPAGAITEFPLAPGFYGGSLSGLTVGPDNNLYFTFSGASDAVIWLVRALPVPSVSAGLPRREMSSSSPEPPSPRSRSFTPYAPTVGSDGNLWFPDGSNVGRLDPALVTLDQAIPPGILSIPNATHSKKGITSIVA